MVSTHTSRGVLRTHIDPGQVDAHILSELTLRLGRRLGVLLELALEDVDLVLAQPGLGLVRLLGVWHAHHGGRLPVSHVGVHTQAVLRVVVVRHMGDRVVSELLEVVVAGLLEVLHCEGGLWY